MGTYYAWVNHTKREKLRLNSLHNSGDKIEALAYPRCGAATAILFAMSTFVGEGVDGEFFGRWVGDEVEVMSDDTISSRFGVHSDELIGFGASGGEAYTDIGPALRKGLEHLGAEFLELDNRYFREENARLKQEVKRLTTRVNRYAEERDHYRERYLKNC